MTCKFKCFDQIAKYQFNHRIQGDVHKIIRFYSNGPENGGAGERWGQALVRRLKPARDSGCRGKEGSPLSSLSSLAASAK
jgi:hypothetical protein